MLGGWDAKCLWTDSWTISAYENSAEPVLTFKYKDASGAFVSTSYPIDPRLEIEAQLMDAMRYFIDFAIRRKGHNKKRIGRG
jgi:hypothetical protein